jgi:hypothetical protein
MPVSSTSRPRRFLNEGADGFSDLEPRDRLSQRILAPLRPQRPRRLHAHGLLPTHAVPHGAWGERPRDGRSPLVRRPCAFPATSSSARGWPRASLGGGLWTVPRLPAAGTGGGQAVVADPFGVPVPRPSPPPRTTLARCPQPLGQLEALTDAQRHDTRGGLRPAHTVHSPYDDEAPTQARPERALHTEPSAKGGGWARQPRFLA